MDKVVKYYLRFFLVCLQFTGGHGLMQEFLEILWLLRCNDLLKLFCCENCNTFISLRISMCLRSYATTRLYLIKLIFYSNRDKVLLYNLHSVCIYSSGSKTDLFLPSSILLSLVCSQKIKHNKTKQSQTNNNNQR